MADPASAYPLSWPERVIRRNWSQRKNAVFKSDGKRLSVAEAIRRIQEEAEHLGARYTVLSTNVELRLDGLPRSGQKEPDDPGAALWFQLKGKPVCLPCDTYDRVADNIAAIAAHIKATRAIERYGVATTAQMFEGFAALAAPGAKRHWREVLGISPTAMVERSYIEQQFRHRAKKEHPDAGGSSSSFDELQRAKEDALREIGS